MTESEIQRQIIQALKAARFLIFRMNAGRVTSNVTLAPKGTPDLLVVSPAGAITWVEVKTATGKLRQSQEGMIGELERRGQRVLIARSVDDIAPLLTQ